MPSDPLPERRTAYPAPSPAAQALAARCESRVNELARRMARDAFERLPGYSELPDDVKDVEVAATVRNGLRLFLRRVQDPQGRVGDYSLFRERAAQRAEEGMPLHTLLRSHSAGVYVLWQALRDEATDEEAGALIELVDFLLRGQETVIGAVTETYVEEQAALSAERREHHRGLVRGLLDGSVPPQRAFEELGLEGPCLVVHLHLPQEQGPATTEVADRRLVRRIQALVDRSLDTRAVSLLGVEGGQVIIPQPADDKDGLRTCEKLCTSLRQVCGNGVRLAAVPAATAQEVQDAARTAADIVRIARACGRPPGLHVMDDVLLEYHLSRRDESSDRIAALLSPIEDRPDLVDTLRVHIEHRHDRRATARRLGLHPNTVDNRLARITELTGLDITSPRGNALALAALLLRSNASG
ncbi:helix-turn-helix domain-containing protein [Streptomyces sp. NBC_00683]|uniref:PucR family transcriptional regulator n=1 Tax=Streptomyces sp. NBC_00683 TaxID=2903670 RepID=UPI002E32C28D|nr:helix-turn-helix domain-containing protein [Streptomyces sp. NBC_00683]